MQWLLLIYKIPREPTAGRVYVWRKLKQLGAVSLQDGAWVLPANPRTQEQFQWLAAEIVEQGGEASLLMCDMVFTSHPKALREAFEAPVREQYQEILAALRRKNRNLSALSKQYVQTKARDYFQCDLGERARTRLLAAEEEDAK
jgi:hypothetical protein